MLAPLLSFPTKECVVQMVVAALFSLRVFFHITDGYLGPCAAQA
jgi:hypothetical protein